MVFVIRLKYVIWPFNRALYVFVAEMKKPNDPAEPAKSRTLKKQKQTKKHQKLLN